MGSNMAEAHPVGFQWVMEAKARGATVIHVDPRYTRTSAVADIHVPLRTGSDIAFLGGLINHVLSNDLWFDDYVRAYTNAPFLIREDFKDTEDLDGLFSGFDPETGMYDRDSWQYENVDRAFLRRRASFEASATRSHLWITRALEGACRRRHHPPDRGFVGDVDRSRMHRSAAGTGAGERLDFFPQQIAGPDLRPALGESLGDGAANAARGAGHDHPPVRKRDVHGPVYRSGSWAVSRRLKMGVRSGLGWVARSSAGPASR